MRLLRALCALLLLVPAACGSGSSGAAVLLPDDLLQADGQTLALHVPPEVQARMSGAYLDLVYQRTLAEPECQDPGGGPVEFVVAEACLEFHDRYLSPGALPPNVAGIPAVPEYVDAIDPADPYVVYYSAEAFETTVEPTLSGDRAYIGIRLEIPEGEDLPVVAEVLPFTRAWWDGVEAQDRIVAVRDPAGGEEIPLAGLTLDQVTAALPRSEAEPVVLVIERDGALVEVPTAAETHIARLLEGRYAYLGVRTFTTETGQQVAADYADLVAAGRVEGTVLDLRHNRGGSLMGALQLADWIIDRDIPARSNPIVLLEDVSGVRIPLFLGSWSGQNADPFPLVVLVDGESASASEVVAGAVRWYGAGDLVGTTTFGKGVSQDVVQLGDGSAVLIPSRRILLPDGTSWNGTGLDPDVPAAPPPGGPTPAYDPQLEAALGRLGTYLPAAAHAAGP